MKKYKFNQDFPLRLERRNFLFPLNLNNFKDAAKELEKMVRDYSGLIDEPEIISCEDRLTYAVQKSTFCFAWDDYILKKRAKYPLEELDEQRWDLGKYIQFSIHTKMGKEMPSSWITMSVDKSEPKKLQIYAQQIDEDLHKRIVNKFRGIF
jgi:hypothetical protein